MSAVPAGTALVVLLVLAGCVGALAPAGTGTTVASVEVVNYEDLPADTRRTIRHAVENGSVVRDADAFDGLSPEEDRYLRFGGTTYALDWNTRYERAEYGLAAVAPVNDSASLPAEDVVAYSNLSERARAIFDQARNAGRTELHSATTFPEPFLEHQYVERRGQHFRLLVVHVDDPQWKLRVDAVESGPNG